MRHQSQDIPEHVQSAFNSFIDAKVEALHAQRRSDLAEGSTLIQAKQDELEAIHAAYRAEFHPKGVHEEFLVREMAYSDWRQQILARIELTLTWIHTVGLYEGEFSGQDFTQLEEKAVSMLLSFAWSRNPKDFSMLYRAQNQARRAYNSALKTLERLRSGKAGYLPPAHPEPKAAVSDPAGRSERAQAAAASANQTKPGGETNPPPPVSRNDETNPISRETGVRQEAPAGNTARPFVLNHNRSADSNRYGRV